MAIDKNFVVRNGLEVNENLIFADPVQKKVGIGTSSPSIYELEVNGGIGATNLTLSNRADIPTIVGSNLYYDNAYVNTGIITNLSGSSISYTSFDVSNLSADNAYIVSGIVTNLSGTISTYTTSNSTNLNATNANINNAYIVSGIATNLSGSISTYTISKSTILRTDEAYIVSGIVTNLSGTISTYTTSDITNLNALTGIVTNLSGSISTYTSSNATTLNASTAYINVGVVTTLSGTQANYLGIVTAGAYFVDAVEVIDNSRELKNIASLDATTLATIESAITNSPNVFTDLKVSGISTFIGIATFASGIQVTSGFSTIPYLDSTNINVTGFTTSVNLDSTNFESTYANVTGILTTATLHVGTGGTVLTTVTTGIGSVGINSTAPRYALDVVGDINTSTSVRVAGVDVLETALADATALAIALG